MCTVTLFRSAERLLVTMNRDERRTAEVVEWRREQFKSWCDEGASEVNGVPSFNLLEVPDRLEWSPMMTRSFSITRSLTQTEVRRGASRLELRYWRRDGERPVDPSRPTTAENLSFAAG